MKRIYKLVIEEQDLNRLKDKANHMGFVGRGAVGHYIIKIARESVVFLDDNVKAVFKALNKP